MNTEPTQNSAALPPTACSAILSCRECGMVFKPVPEEFTPDLKKMWEAIDICSKCSGEQLQKIIQQNAQ